MVLSGIRLLCLASQTHDGLPDELYWSFHGQVVHASGFNSVALLASLRKLKLLAPRSDFESSREAASGATGSNDVGARTIKNTGSSMADTAIAATKAITAAASKLTLRRRSTYKYRLDIHFKFISFLLDHSV
ncbi:unnamed protein product [Protopolystoma xenopodis]|uniref:Uncharacterized protein n=1 Tax=Protopolystoma xenopodis TaxID=117903 RepID=A0A448XRR0_9PLAT|nr:unnamed protein product [Protopolystoma xenopodis]